MAANTPSQISLVSSPVSSPEKSPDSNESISPVEEEGEGIQRALRHSSTQSFGTPSRHHTRTFTAPRKVKETLNARSEYTTSEDDGAAQHRINQYIIKQEIGRGSFGAVHLAVDQYGEEYAVKEFSKSRLRKRQQSHVLRRPRGPQRPGTAFNSPLHRHPTGKEEEVGYRPLDLIKEEIAIMKKLNHTNLVSLLEVLDDPTEDSLYMVMEMCKKGVIMKVGLEERADPYDDERCRCWFRDLILAIEYLHHQGIVHRDIKPDNCLLTSDDVLKVVDFGVSEMFAKDSDMYTAKSAGSPAFLPPELCVVKHGDVSGKAADIWSMGVTLYCLRYGRIPFEKESIFELYEAIRGDDVDLTGETDEDFLDLMRRILEKEPSKRITMRELRDHAWVTKKGTDPLLSEAENTAQMLEPPTEEEMNSAITNNLSNLFVVMKAVNRFKKLVDPARATGFHSILGKEGESHFVQPPLEMDMDEDLGAFQPYKRIVRDKNIGNRKPARAASSQERGRPIKRPDSTELASPDELDPSRQAHSGSRSTSEGSRGHAKDPLAEENPYLFIGPSTYTGISSVKAPPPKPGTLMIPDLDEPDKSIEGIPAFSRLDDSVEPPDYPVVSESPGPSDIDIYETAYREEIERLKKENMSQPDSMTTKVFLTRRVEGKLHHLSDVLQLIGQAQEESAKRAKSEPVLHLGDKISGAFASAGAAVSALAAQVEARRQQPIQSTQAEAEEQSAPTGGSNSATSPLSSIPPRRVMGKFPSQFSGSETGLNSSGPPTTETQESTTPYSWGSASDKAAGIAQKTAELSRAGFKSLFERVRSRQGETAPSDGDNRDDTGPSENDQPKEKTANAP